MRTQGKGSLAEVVEDREARRLERIVFLSDLSPESDAAMLHALPLATALGARLTVFHAVTTSPDASDASPEVLAEAGRRQERDARESLERQLGPHRDVSVVIARSDCTPARWFDRLAVLKPDLLIVATHERATLASHMPGSVTEQSLRSALAPVLAIREPAHGTAGDYRRILVPTDLSQASRRAFPLAATLARVFHADITVLYVSRLPRARSLSGISYAVHAAVPEGDLVAGFLGGGFEGLRVRSLVDAGSAAGRILEAARRHRHDLIVMARHTEHGLASRLFGGVAEQVVKESTCPVLVAP